MAGMDHTGLREKPEMKLFAVPLLSLALLFACASSPPAPWTGEIIPYEYEAFPFDPEAAGARASAAVETSPEVSVVFIGFDGWGGWSLPRADMPWVKRMMAEGSSTLEAQAVLPTNSWPNWSSLFFASPPEVHGFVENGGAPYFAGPLRDVYGCFPSIFGLLKTQRPQSTIALFYEWDRIGLLCPPGAADLSEQVPDLSADPEAGDRIARYLRENRPSLTVIVFDEPDHTGHSRGYGSKAYYDRLAVLDRYAERLAEAVREGGYYDDTVFILSADHGGVLYGHGFNSPRQRNIPLIIRGKNIRQNAAIPGGAHIYDIAPTIAEIFNLRPPLVWTGRALKEVFIE